MDDDPNSLHTLEWYVKQLFSGNSNNEQIQKIHKMLENFSCQKGAWRKSLYFLNQTAHDQTAMFSLTVLEGFITKGWAGLSNEEQLELRTTLYHWLLEKHNCSPYFIRNKAVQLVVHIARSDWPDKYPDFYNNVLSLVSSTSPPSTVLGLLFLQTASEELGTPRDNVLSSRKRELKERLLQLVPQTLLLLTGLLESIWEKQNHSITSTPPPSPTNPSPLNSMTHNFTTGSSSTSSLNSETEPVVRAALQCLTHFFSWIPLSSHVTPQLMELVFRYVGMGTQQSVPQLSTSSEFSVPVLAVGTINEMLYKNCVPVEFENFVVLLFNNSCFVLHHLVQNSNSCRLPNPINPQFVEKFVELIHLLVSSHLRRLEGRSLPLFSVPQFLALFFSFTFEVEQSDWTRYSSCLDTWQVFLDYIKESSKSNHLDSPALRYRDSLVTLSESVLSKVLHFTNGVQLAELDDEAIDGNMETESKKMLRQSIEIFVTVGEILKNQTLSQLNDSFQRCTAAYQTLVSLSTTSNGVVQIESKSQLKELLILLKDLASLLQLIGRLSELHTGPDYQDHFEVGKSLVEKLLDLSLCGTTVASLKFVGCPDKELKSLLTQVHAHCLSSLQAWCHWISLLVHSNVSKEPAESLVFALVASATSVFTPAWPVGGEGAEHMYHASLQLLTSVICVIRSHFLWNCSTWNQLFLSVHDIQYLPPAIHRQLLCCVLGSAVVAWRNCSAEEQRWDERQTYLKNAVENVTKGTWLLLQQLLRKESNQLVVQGKPAFVATLALLSELSTIVHDESTPSKVVLYSTLSMWIEPTLNLLSMDLLFMDDHEVTEAIFNFYLSVFDCLLNQIGSSQAEKAVQTFLQTFNQHNIQTTLRQGNTHGVRAVERLLRILQIVVQEPGAAFKRFLPSTLTLCLEHIYPCVAQLPSSDLKETLYHLLTLILSHHWRSFFKGSVLTKFGSQESNQMETVENQPQFLGIMTAYVQSFMLPDINIFQQNLAALDTLHSKWKLYHKGIFRAGITKEFINTLFEVLATGSHELLREEIGLSIYAMASAQFDAFFQQILPNYLVTCQGIVDQQRILLKNGFAVDTDLPSFTQNVHQFTYDLRCYRSTNSSSASLYRS